MLINGSPGQTIPVSDRGLLYGDGVFETIRLINHQLSLWPLHQSRLLKSCKLLGIILDLSCLMEELDKLISNSPADGIVKIIISRGSGGRGYLPTEECEAVRIVQFHSLPQSYNRDQDRGIRLKFCDQPVSVNSKLGGIKHLGRLDQVLASRELSELDDEGLMCTDSGRVVEGTKSNLFAVVNNRLVTPNLDDAGVAGVMREYLIKQFSTAGIAIDETELSREDLCDGTEMFMCNSVFGVWPVKELVYAAGNNTRIFHYKVGPLTRRALEFQDDEFSSYQ